MQPEELTDSLFPHNPNVWAGRRTQQAYIAGGATTLLVLLLLSFLGCTVYACFRFWHSSKEEKKELRRRMRARQLTDSPQQQGNKYMPQIDASQEELNHECSSSTQTFFFPGQKQEIDPERTTWVDRLLDSVVFQLVIPLLVFQFLVDNLVWKLRRLQ